MSKLLSLVLGFFAGFGIIGIYFLIERIVEKAGR